MDAEACASPLSFSVNAREQPFVCPRNIGALDEPFLDLPWYVVLAEGGRTGPQGSRGLAEGGGDYAEK